MLHFLYLKRSLLTKNLILVVFCLVRIPIADALGGVYPKVDDPLRNSIVMVSSVSNDHIQNGIKGSVCGGVILSSQNGYPVLITAAHCLVPNLKALKDGSTVANNQPIDLDASSVIAYVASRPDVLEVKNPSFANPTAQCSIVNGILDLRDCSLGNIDGFVPNNSAVIAVANMGNSYTAGFFPGTNNVQHYFYIPPKINGHRPDFIVVPLEYTSAVGSRRTLQDIGSSSPIVLPSSLDSDLNDNSFLYGWSLHYDRADSLTPVYGRLSMEQLVADYRSTKSAYKIKPYATLANQQFMTGGDSGSPVIAFVTKDNKFSHFELRGIASLGFREADGEPTIDYAADIRQYSNWIRVVLDNDGEKQKIINDPLFTAEMRTSVSCEFAKRCRFSW